MGICILILMVAVVAWLSSQNCTLSKEDVCTLHLKFFQKSFLKKVLMCVLSKEKNRAWLEWLLWRWWQCWSRQNGAQELAINPIPCDTIIMNFMAGLPIAQGDSRSDLGNSQFNLVSLGKEEIKSREQDNWVQLLLPAHWCKLGCVSSLKPGPLSVKWGLKQSCSSRNSISYNNACQALSAESGACQVLSKW